LRRIRRCLKTGDERVRIPTLTGNTKLAAQELSAVADRQDDRYGIAGDGRERSVGHVESVSVLRVGAELGFNLFLPRKTAACRCVDRFIGSAAEWHCSPSLHPISPAESVRAVPGALAIVQAVATRYEARLVNLKI
jgi:hypothetical protein